MLLASMPPGVLASFRDRLLGPLRSYDRRRGTRLLPTLAAFLGCSGSWQACAARLHVHVNTLRYRIRRIEELTGRDLSSLPDQVDFFLALTVAGREAASSPPEGG
jgi:DNA-binding PucR family transcriptional regulator